MARMTVEEVYRGEKYDVMGAATANYLMNGRPAEYDERTWLDVLLVKYALIASEKMRNEGDMVSGMTDSVPPYSYVRWMSMTTLEDLYYGNIAPYERYIKHGQGNKKS